MAQHNLTALSTDVGFAQSSSPEDGSTVLNLVYRAAEVRTSMEAQAREMETRAKALCQSAAENLKRAEERAEIAEHSRLKIINEANCKLQEAARALTEARLRIIATEDQLMALEIRAQAAETEAREARRALTLVEDAIRRRLLSASPEAEDQLGS